MTVRLTIQMASIEGSEMSTFSERWIAEMDRREALMRDQEEEFLRAYGWDVNPFGRGNYVIMPPHLWEQVCQALEESGIVYNRINGDEN